MKQIRGAVSSGRPVAVFLDGPSQSGLLVVRRHETVNAPELPEPAVAVPRKPLRRGIRDSRATGGPLGPSRTGLTPVPLVPSPGWLQTSPSLPRVHCRRQRPVARHADPTEALTTGYTRPTVNRDLSPGAYCLAIGLHDGLPRPSANAMCVPHTKGNPS